MKKFGSEWMRMYSKVKYFCEKRCFTVRADCLTGNNEIGHTPVMVQEVIEHLDLKDGDTILDMTFGAGGHSRKLIEKYKNLKVIALDRDPLAHQFAENLQKQYPNQIIPLLGKFSELHELLTSVDVPFQSVDGIIFDLGASSMQMDTPERGFSISKPGPLDMRMDGQQTKNQITASDVVNYASEDDLYKIFKIYGEERQSRLIARTIVQTRYTYQYFNTTQDLANLIELVSSRPQFDKLQRRAHSGTKIFQALRIFVNNELNELNHGLLLANLCLKLGGRIVVLSFHSLEDTIVKKHLQGHNEAIFSSPASLQFASFKGCDERLLKECMAKPWKPTNKKVVVPTSEEVAQNPRSRSAKLRAATKINDIKFPPSQVNF